MTPPTKDAAPHPVAFPFGSSPGALWRPARVSWGIRFQESNSSLPRPPRTGEGEQVRMTSPPPPTFLRPASWQMQQPPSPSARRGLLPKPSGARLACGRWGGSSASASRVKREAQAGDPTRASVGLGPLWYPAAFSAGRLHLGILCLP